MAQRPHARTTQATNPPECTCDPAHSHLSRPRPPTRPPSRSPDPGATEWGTPQPGPPESQAEWAARVRAGGAPGVTGVRGGGTCGAEAAAGRDPARPSPPRAPQPRAAGADLEPMRQRRLAQWLPRGEPPARAPPAPPPPRASPRAPGGLHGARGGLAGPRRCRAPCKAIPGLWPPLPPFSVMLAGFQQLQSPCGLVGGLRAFAPPVSSREVHPHVFTHILAWLYAFRSLL